MARHPLLWGAASPPSSAPGGLRAAHGESLFAAAALNTSLIDVATRSTRGCPVPAAAKRAAPHPTVTHLPGGRGLRHQQWSTAGASDGTAEHLLGLPRGETGLAKGRHRAGLRLSSLKSKAGIKVCLKIYIPWVNTSYFSLYAEDDIQLCPAETCMPNLHGVSSPSSSRCFLA